MKSCPPSRVALLAATTLSLLSTTACRAPAAAAPSPAEARPSTSGDLFLAAGRRRAAFVAYLDACVAAADGVAWAADDEGRRACAAAFELRSEAADAELARWREVGVDVCGGATTPSSIAVCRGVAELSLAGPLEDHRRAREALVRGCHVHGDYAACMRLQALGDTVRVARVAWPGRG